MKKILITGADSYIGGAVERWLTGPEFIGNYQVVTVDMRGERWSEKDFSGYDAVLHVAGIAHADTGRVTEEQKELYYAVNCELAAATARKARREGVSQFIYMSSIIVYGEGASIGERRVIRRDTRPSPASFYGDSKWLAEKKLRRLEQENFHVAVLRPPMIYGECCRGNYQTLRRLARKLPFFPDFPNERSMLYIGNLCEFIRLLIESAAGGTFFPQNADYVRTSEMVQEIARVHGKRIVSVRWLNGGLYLSEFCPGRVGGMVKKAFGTLVYEKEMSESLGKYRRYDLKRSIRLTEMGTAR